MSNTRVKKLFRKGYKRVMDILNLLQGNTEGLSEIVNNLILQHYVGNYHYYLNFQIVYCKIPKNLIKKIPNKI